MADRREQLFPTLISKGGEKGAEREAGKLGWVVEGAARGSSSSSGGLDPTNAEGVGRATGRRRRRRRRLVSKEAAADLLQTSH